MNLLRSNISNIRHNENDHEKIQTYCKVNGICGVDIFVDLMDTLNQKLKC